MQILSKKLKIFLVALLIVAVSGLAAVSRLRSQRQPFSRANLNARAGNARAGSEKIVVSFVGDCTFGSVNGDRSTGRFPAVYKRSGKKDYPFALVHSWLVGADLSVANFECTLTNATKTAQKQWKFKGDKEYASILRAGGIDVVSLANNHSHDYKEQGFQDTIHNLKVADIGIFYQNSPYITTVKGVQVVVIGDCTVVGENTTRIDGCPARVAAQIHRYKRPDNIVIVMLHWGCELDQVPQPWQQKLGQKLIDLGADAVVGCHSHVAQGIEFYKQRFIVYSLGNFAFGGNSLAHHPETFILRLSFFTENDKIRRYGLSIAPCLTSSSNARTLDGALKNNYQPVALSGQKSSQVMQLILKRSAPLKFGIKRIAPYGKE
jgi:poly-gamma-glutamate synthesis protein (capsule biosynthesis protein)